MPVDYFPNYHATLLRRAAPQGFSKAALLFRVIPANIAVDLNQTDKWLHFDDSAFLAGVEHIETLWAAIQAGNRRMSNFGRLTHTVQDFYSHSNWVELHQHVEPPAGLGPDDCYVCRQPLHTGTYPGRVRRPGQSTPTHAELNKDCPFGWFSPSGARVVAEGPNRGKTLFELGYRAALAATRVQFDRLTRVLSQD